MKKKIFTSTLVCSFLVSGVVAPLPLVSVSCAEDSGDIKFTIAETKMIDVSKGRIKLNCGSFVGRITMPELSFTYGDNKETTAKLVDGKTRPIIIELDFNEKFTNNGVENGILKFRYKIPGNSKEWNVTINDIKINLYSDALCFTDDNDGYASQVGYSINSDTVGTSQPLDIDLYWSRDQINWNSWNYGERISLNSEKAGEEKVYIRNTKGTLSNKTTYFWFNMIGDVKASGNIKSMVNYQPLTEWCFSRMFQHCGQLIQAPELPYDTLADNCYYRMFYDCDFLRTAPELPAINLANGCYKEMFSNCLSLLNGPTKLPALQLTNQCYYEMFFECESLINAPVIDAQNLADECCYNMFYDCMRLKSIEHLPAKNLARRCYAGMFHSCSLLEKVPDELPAEKLAESCYLQMFDNCTSLTSAPKICATELAKNCCRQMFEGCSKLTSANNLLVKQLKEYCYMGMFSDCDKMVAVPALANDLELAEGSCASMFQGCDLLQVREEQDGTSPLDKIFTCPNYIPSQAVDGMFQYTTHVGDWEGNPKAGKSYYFVMNN